MTKRIRNTIKIMMDFLWCFSDRWFALRYFLINNSKYNIDFKMAKFNYTLDLI